MKRAVIFLCICIMLSALFCGCGKDSANQTTGNYLNTEMVDSSKLVTYEEGEYQITEVCDWLTADLRYDWDKAFNDDRETFIEVFIATYPNQDSNYRDKKYLSFLGECLYTTISQPMTPDVYLSNAKNEIYATEWDGIIYRYLELVESDYRYDYNANPNLYSLLSHEISDGCIDITNYSDSFQGYDKHDMAMMAYIVDSVDSTPDMSASTLLSQLRDHYAQTDCFLFYVYAMKFVIGMSGDAVDISNELLFEYDVRSGSVSYIDVYDPTEYYAGKPVYAVADIPDGYLDEDAIAAYQAYLDENGWSY